MSKNSLNKNLGILLGTLFIFVGIVLTVFLASNNSIYQIKAGPGHDPKEIEITNIFNDSFTVSYFTNDKIIGTINYGEDLNSLDSIALDDRDQLSQTANMYNMHSITVRNLKPRNSYYFVIISGDKKYTNNGIPYSTTTGSVINTDPLSQNPISGKVVMPSGIIPSEGLAYVEIQGAQKISTLIGKEGLYILPLNSLRNINLDSYFSLIPKNIINIKIKTPTMFSSINISPDQTNPVPLITISNNYDFSNNASAKPLPTQISKQTFPKISGKKRVIKIPSTIKTPTIKADKNLSDASITPSPNISPKKNDSSMLNSIKSIFIK